MSHEDTPVIVRTVAAMRAATAAWRREALSVGFVPTMGYLHEGHASLVRRAKAENDRVVVSVYVNPTQFGPQEDLAAYPRDLEHDRAICAAAGVDLMFVPDDGEVYPEGDATIVEVGRVTEGLCGKFRPGHFRGVATVVTKLLNIVQPDRAYFGMKDFQQLIVIRRMATDLHLPVDIVPCPLVREPDGLAMSSRNKYLNAAERRRALALSAGLQAAAALFDAGERRASELSAAVREALAAEGVTPQYVEVVDAETLERVAGVERPALLAIAAYVGATRLIDNIVLTPQIT